MVNKIHAGIFNGSISGYACNMHCGYHPDNIDFSWKEVTCKNCLKLISKYGRYTGNFKKLIMLGEKKCVK